MRLKKLLLFSLILLGSSLPVSTLAATYTCGTNGVPNSCTPSGMQTLINSASNGDTINIATGTHAWTAQPTGVMLNKRITISGGGTYAVDANHNDVGTWPVQLNTGTATAFKITAGVGPGTPRIRGISFFGNPPFNYNFGDANAGLFINMSPNTAFYRIDNNKFHSTGAHLGIYANSPGLIDHNYFQSDATDGHGIMVQNWGASGNGDEVWMAPVGFGTASTFVFIETNTFIRPNIQASFENSVVDAYVGGKYVLRYNYIRNANVLNHDKSGGGWTRAGQSFEIYNNTFDYTIATSWFCAMFGRDGTFLYYNNDHKGFYQAWVKFWNRRMTEAEGNWGVCDGTKLWDRNVGPGGYPCADQVGRGAAAGLGSLTVQLQPRVPVRLWNNTGPFTGGCGGTVQHGGKICNLSPTTIIDGVDYIISDDSSAALPGYTPYQYPHPLVSGGTTVPAPPTNLRIQ